MYCKALVFVLLVQPIPARSDEAAAITFVEKLGGKWSGTRISVLEGLGGAPGDDCLHVVQRELLLAGADAA
jgi:hypothetical protein